MGHRLGAYPFFSAPFYRGIPMNKKHEGFFIFRDYIDQLSPRAAMLLSFLRCRQAHNAKHRRGLPRFSNAWLAKYFKCSPRQMSRAIAECVAAGLLTRIQNGHAPSLFRVAIFVQSAPSDTPEMASQNANSVQSETSFGNQLIPSNEDNSKDGSGAGIDQLAPSSTTKKDMLQSDEFNHDCCADNSGGQAPEPPRLDGKVVGSGIEANESPERVFDPKCQPVVDVRAHAKRLAAINLAIMGDPTL